MGLCIWRPYKLRDYCEIFAPIGGLSGMNHRMPPISYASRVIANFVPNFVAMATVFNGGQPGVNINVTIN